MAYTTRQLIDEALEDLEDKHESLVRRYLKLLEFAQEVAAERLMYWSDKVTVILREIRINE